MTEQAVTVTWTSHDEAQTEALGAQLAQAMGGRGVVLLRGDLGSGKTVMVRGMAAALGVDRREIQSPTYALVHQHSGDAQDLVHCDLYRLQDDEVDSLGLDEHLEGKVLLVIEWPDRWSRCPSGAVEVHFETESPTSRRLRVAGLPPLD